MSRIMALVTGALAASLCDPMQLVAVQVTSRKWVPPAAEQLTVTAPVHWRPQPMGSGYIDLAIAKITFAGANQVESVFTPGRVGSLRLWAGVPATYGCTYKVALMVKNIGTEPASPFANATVTSGIDVVDQVVKTPPGGGELPLLPGETYTVHDTLRISPGSGQHVGIEVNPYWALQPYWNEPNKSNNTWSLSLTVPDCHAIAPPPAPPKD